jgi:hypothetical protein
MRRPCLPHSKGDAHEPGVKIRYSHVKTPLAGMAKGMILSPTRMRRICLKIAQAFRVPIN